MLNAVCDSVAAVSALDISQYQYALAIDYYQPGGYGGGGQYVYVGTSVAVIDNGTVLAASGGVGRWVLAQNYPVTLLQFGALPDGSDQTAAVQAAYDWAIATGKPLDISGNFSVVTISVPNAIALHTIGSGMLTGIAAAATFCILELSCVVDMVLEGRLMLYGAYSTNYTCGLWIHTTSSSHTTTFLDFSNMRFSGCVVAYILGSLDEPDDQISEINIRGGFSEGCPTVCLAIGAETVVNIDGATNLSASGPGADWQAIPQKTFVAIGGTINVTGGEGLHPLSTIGTFCEVQPIASATRGNVYGSASFNGIWIEAACQFATSANPRSVPNPVGGLIKFVGCPGIHTQNTSPLIETDPEFTGKIVVASGDFEATTPRSFPNILCHGAAHVWCDDVSFGQDFLPAIAGISGSAIAHFGERMVLSACNLGAQSIPNAAQTNLKFTSLDTTGDLAHFASWYDGTSFVVGSGGLKNVRIEAQIVMNGLQGDFYIEINGAALGDRTVGPFCNVDYSCSHLNAGDVVTIVVQNMSGANLTANGLNTDWFHIFASN